MEDTLDGIKKSHIGQNSLVERHQRNSIMKGLKNCDDNDLVIISDVDEIPDLNKLNLFNEENVLDLRFNILDEFVDFFVITESTTDHQGRDKKLNFNMEKFKKFKKKIIYVIVEDTLDNIKKSHIGQNSLVERHQRNSIMKGLKNCDDNDLVIISDFD